MPVDSQLKVRVCDHGTDVYERSVFLRSAYEANGDKIALIEPVKGDSMSEEDSGSPVLLNGKVAGSVFAEADVHHLYARSIEQQMEATRGIAVASKVVLSTTQPEMANAILRHLGPSFVDRYVVQRAPNGLALPPSRAGAIAPIPGRKFAASFLTGPDASIYVTSAFTLQIADGRWLATGHSLGGDHLRKLPVSIAYVDGRLDDGSIWAHPVGDAFGTLTTDTRYGSVIDATADSAVLIPIKTSFSLDGTGFTHTHQVTSDNGSNDEQIATEMGLSTGLYKEIGSSRKEMHGNAVLTLSYGDGSTKTFDFTEDPNNAGQLQGTGVDVFYSIFYWMADKFSGLVGNETEPTRIDLDVSLTSGFPSQD